MPTDEALASATERLAMRKKLAMVNANDPAMRSNAQYKAITGRDMAVPGAVLLNTSPNGTAAYGEAKPPTAYSLDTAAKPVPAPVPGAPSQSDVTVPTRQDAMRADLARDRIRANIQADDSARHNYLMQKLRAGLTTPDQIAEAEKNAADRHQIQLGEAALVRGPSVKTPEQNAVALQQGDRSLYGQISKVSADDPGYQRAAQGVYGRFYGSTPAQDVASGALPIGPGSMLNPLKFVEQANRMNLRGPADQAGYAARGQGMTDSQDRERQAYLDRANAAGEEYQRYRDSRAADEQYSTGMVRGTQERNLADVRAGAAEATQRETLARALTSMAPDQASAIIARNKADALKAQGELATATSGVSADVAQANRAAAFKEFGVNPDAFTNGAVDELSKFTSSMSGAVTGKVTGGTFGGAEDLARASSSFLNNRVRVIQRMAAKYPDVARELAAMILHSGSAPMPGEGGGFTAGTFGGQTTATPFDFLIQGVASLPVNVRNRQTVATNLTESYKILKQLAGE